MSASLQPRPGRDLEPDPGPHREAPLAEALAALARGPRHDFHALPWGTAVDVAPPGLRRLYRDLFGDAFARADVPLGAPALDSPVRPHGPLRRAQELAATAFGADATFFLTGGTSAANRAALDALDGPGRHVMIDGAAHQSVFFAARSLRAQVAFTGVVDGDGARRADLAGTLEVLERRRRDGRPVDVLLLTGTTYDGWRAPLGSALPAIAAASPGTVVVVDEAWAAIHAFAAATATHSALPAAARAGREAPPLVVTHSAHKTLCALRQGSYLHVRGPIAVRRAVADAVLRHQTTSPSWPMLASLDLARAHAEEVAPDAVPAAIARAQRLRGRLAGHPATTATVVVPPVSEEADPLVVGLCLPTPSAARALRRRLLDRGISLPRAGPRTLVARVHLGVRDDDVDALVDALVAEVPALDEPARHGPIGERRDDPVVGRAVPDLVLPYPPGVPLARPGELWTGAHARRLDAERAAGADVVRVTAPPTARAAVVVDCADPDAAAGVLRDLMGLAARSDGEARTVALPGGADLVLRAGTSAAAAPVVRLTVAPAEVAAIRARAAGGDTVTDDGDGVRIALPDGPRIEIRAE